MLGLVAKLGLSALRPYKKAENTKAEAAVPRRRSWAPGAAVLVCTSVLRAGEGLFLDKLQNAKTSPTP